MNIKLLQIFKDYQYRIITLGFWFGLLVCFTWAAGGLETYIPFLKASQQTKAAYLAVYISLIVPLFLYLLQNRRQIQDEKHRYIELYKLFISKEMRERRKVSWIMLKRAIQHPDYADLLLSKSFMDRYQQKASMENEKDIYRACGMNEQEIEDEFENSHRLDDLVSFYQLLSSIRLSKDPLSCFDFCYDSWRPLLYWYANELNKRYLRDINQQYSAKPRLFDSLVRIDKMFERQPYIGQTPNSAISEHPLLLYLKEKNIATVDQE